MATRNINNYINRLLNENKRDIEAETRPKGYENLDAEGKKKDDALVADAQKDLDRYDQIQANVRAETDRNTKMAQDSRAKVDASLASSKDFAQELAAYKAQDKARRERIAGLRSGQGTNQEREARITDSQKAIMSDNAKSIASNILKGFGAATGRSTARAEVERRPMPAGRPDDGRPVAEKKPAIIDFDRRPIDTGTKKPESRESFPSRGGKNKRLAIAAQADKTGDAYMDQVMKTGAGKTLKGGKVKRGIIPGAIGNVGAVNPFTRPDAGDPFAPSSDASLEDIKSAVEKSIRARMGGG